MNFEIRSEVKNVGILERIAPAAEEFMNSLLKLSIEAVEELAFEKYGYTLEFFNIPGGDIELSRKYECLRGMKLSGKDGFTICYGDAKLILIDDEMHPEHKLQTLLHEMGHIILGHVGSGKINYLDRRLIEFEANAFAYEVLLEYHKRLVSF